MELLQGIRTRISIRAFRDKPIDKSILEKIILAASNTPSSSNTQPWEIAIVANRKREELVHDLYQAGQLEEGPRPHFPFSRAWSEQMSKRSSIHAKRRFEAAKIAPNDREAKRSQFLRNFLFFDAPVAIIVNMDGCLGSCSVFDLGLFVQNLILAAHGMGLATCIQAMPVAYPDTIAKCLGIPPSKRIAEGR